MLAPSRELTYFTLGKGTSSLKVPLGGDTLVPRKGTCPCVQQQTTSLGWRFCFVGTARKPWRRLGGGEMIGSSMTSFSSHHFLQLTGQPLVLWFPMRSRSKVFLQFARLLYFKGNWGARISTSFHGRYLLLSILCGSWMRGSWARSATSHVECGDLQVRGVWGFGDLVHLIDQWSTTQTLEIHRDSSNRIFIASNYTW